MAVTTGSLTVPGQTRSLAHSPGIIKQSIYETSSDQLHPLGTRLEVGDRVFHYTKNGLVALIDGVLLQGAVPVPNHLDCLVATTSAIGDTKLKVTLGNTLLTANYYAEGYLHGNNVAPEGNAYKIQGHLAADASAAVWINLYDPMYKAFTASSSKVTLTKNPWDSVVVAPNAALTSSPVGVAIVDVAASYYFWAQTWGPCAVLTQGTIVIGAPVGLGGTTDGEIGPITAYTTSVIGSTLQVNASTDFSLIFLKIAP
jgi:hypothetical protein